MISVMITGVVTKMRWLKGRVEKTVYVCKEKKGTRWSKEDLKRNMQSCIT